MLEEKRRKPQRTPCPPLVSVCQRARGARTRAQHHWHVGVQPEVGRARHTCHSTTAVEPTGLVLGFHRPRLRIPSGGPSKPRVCGQRPITRTVSPTPSQGSAGLGTTRHPSALEWTQPPPRPPWGKCPNPQRERTGHGEALETKQ